MPFRNTKYKKHIFNQILKISNLRICPWKSTSSTLEALRKSERWKETECSARWCRLALHFDSTFESSKGSSYLQWESTTALTRDAAPVESNNYPAPNCPVDQRENCAGFGDLRDRNAFRCRRGCCSCSFVPMSCSTRGWECCWVCPSRMTRTSDRRWDSPEVSMALPSRAFGWRFSSSAQKATVA